MFIIDPHIQMWVVFGVIIFALVSYAWEKISLEQTSLIVLSVLLIFFQFFPVLDPNGRNALNPERLLLGFANPALITVLCLLVLGQGITQTGALDRITRIMLNSGKGKALLSIFLILCLVIIISGFMNNTPVVVLLIPVMQVLAKQFQRSPSSVMIPLSYAAILGGSITLIGSSTNLLVSGSLEGLGEKAFSFFEFSIPGIVLALVGLVYVFCVVPYILPDRASLAKALVGSSNKQFIAQITVTAKSELVGKKTMGGFFPNLKDITVFMIQRDEHAEVPPFDDITIQQGDILIVAATREVLTETLKSDPGLIYTDGEIGDTLQESKGEQVLAEAMVAPGSRMIGMNLEQLGFRHRYHCIVLGLQRRSRMIRAKITEMRLEAGDVMLIQGNRQDIKNLRSNQDILVIEKTATDLPSPYHSRRALMIFAAVIASAGFGMIPIVVAAFAGAALMMSTGVLNIRQVGRAIDRRIIMLIATSLALGPALQETGGANFIATNFLSIVDGLSPAVILSAFFLIVAFLTNVISNNACAVLFTPIAIELANKLDVSILPFAVAVVFAANCSFASPIGYQTNLLVMGPGHYKFNDFVKAGVPLVIILWITFSLFAPWYYNL